jgi:oligopeptide/dipeptide ABC transporter ATP-binding protein
VEREILEMIRQLQLEHGFAVVFITHDLGRMLQFSHRVAVLYAARLVESGPAGALRESPRHPYTQGLIRAMPGLGPEPGPASSIPGSPPSLLHPPSGCRFHPRCEMAVEACRERSPELRDVAPGHTAACHLLEPSPGD